MASATNVVFMDYRIKDVVFLISLTQSFSATLLLPIPTSFLLFSVDLFSGFALTFSGNTCLIKICVVDFQSLINRLCVKFHIALFSPYCCLYCLYEESSAHISFSLRFAVIMDKLKHKYLLLKKGTPLTYLFLEVLFSFSCSA